MYFANPMMYEVSPVQSRLSQISPSGCRAMFAVSHAGLLLYAAAAHAAAPVHPVVLKSAGRQ